MVEVTLDAGMLAQFKKLHDYIKLRDEAGEVIGFFLPADRAAARVIFGVQSPYSREEIERRYREEAKDARPLSEFWDSMRQKYPDHQFP